MKGFFSLARLLATAFASVSLVAQLQVLESGPHHRVLQSITVGTDEAGNPVSETNTWTEVATGLNHLSPATGQWEESQPAFQVTPGGEAVAVRAQHQVILAANLNAGGSVDLQMPMASDCGPIPWV